MNQPTQMKKKCISIQNTLKFVLNCPINNTPTLVQMMAWCWVGDNPLSESLMFTNPHWYIIIMHYHMEAGHFQMHVLDCKSRYFDWDFIEICYQMFNELYVNTGSGNGLVLKCPVIYPYFSTMQLKDSFYVVTHHPSVFQKVKKCLENGKLYTRSFINLD